MHVTATLPCAIRQPLDFWAPACLWFSENTKGHFPGLLCGWPGVNNLKEWNCLAKGPSTCRQEGLSGIRKPSETLTDKPGWSDNWQTLHYALLTASAPHTDIRPFCTGNSVGLIPCPNISWSKGTFLVPERDQGPLSPSWVPSHHIGHGPGSCRFCWLPGSWVLSCGATGSGCVRVSGWCTCGLYPQFGTHICSLVATQPESPQSPYRVRSWRTAHICLYSHIPTHSYIHLSIHSSAYLSTHPSVHLSTYLPTHPSISSLSSVHQSFWQTLMRHLYVPGYLRHMHPRLVQQNMGEIWNCFTGKIQ